MSALATYLQQLGNFTLMLAFWVAVIVGAFETTRRIVVLGPSKHLVFYLTTFLFVSAVVGGVYYWVHQTETDLVAGFSVVKSKPLPEDWAKDRPIEARHEGSKAYATAAFRGEGLLLKHLDANGAWVEFRPSAEDIAHRDAAVAVTTQLVEQSKLFTRLAYEWWLGFLVAAAFGYVIGQSTRRRAANSTAEPDARNPGARGSP